jgi:ABC-type multidrug transport system ATPase subunit
LVSIHLNNLGKKFGSEWIFRNLTFYIDAGEKVVILGGNGSGKSTLLQMISGYVGANQGEIKYINTNVKPGGIETKIDPDKLKNYISYASPYLQLVEDFTLTETIEHSQIFKPFINRLKTKEVIEILELNHAKDKFIKQFSSGMKQRLKLGLAILSDTPLLLLDEPVSNLDRDAISWYKNLIQNYTTNRTVLVCSNNIDEEFFFCKKHLNVIDFKIAKTV